MNPKNIINAVKVTIILFVVTLQYLSLSKQNNWTNSIEIEKYLKWKKLIGRSK